MRFPTPPANSSGIEGATASFVLSKLGAVASASTIETIADENGNETEIPVCAPPTPRQEVSVQMSQAIYEGFVYETHGKAYHFTCSLFDQANFADTANLVILRKISGETAPGSVRWDATAPDGTRATLEFDDDSFLELYRAYTAHKQAVLDWGNEQKLALEQKAE